MSTPLADTTPRLPLDGRTLIMDAVTQHQVMWIDGVVSLPVGAVIQLGPPNVDAPVVAVRLQAGKNTRSALLVLEVEVPAAYWDVESGR
jgi:hypothetical protein